MLVVLVRWYWWVLGFVFVVWDLLAMGPVFLATKLHQNENLKAGESQTERGRQEDHLVRGEQFEGARWVCYHITF